METVLYVLLLIILLLAAWILLGGVYYRIFFGEIYPTYRSAAVRAVEDLAKCYEQIFGCD